MRPWLGMLCILHNFASRPTLIRIAYSHLPADSKPLTVEAGPQHSLRTFCKPGLRSSGVRTLLSKTMRREIQRASRLQW